MIAGDDKVNVVSVDMRKVLLRFSEEPEWAGHAMYCEGKLNLSYKCFNSWGHEDKIIPVSMNEPSAKPYHVFFGRIIKKGYNGRPDEVFFNSLKVQKNILAQNSSLPIFFASKTTDTMTVFKIITNSNRI